MIHKNEIFQIAKSLGLLPATIEKDYVLGWILMGIQSHEKCNKSRSEEHTSELQSHSFISYAVFCLKKKNKQKTKEDIKKEEIDY